MKKLLILALLFMGCDDNGGSACDSSGISGTWDMHSVSIYPLGCIGECIEDCESIDNETTSHFDSDSDLKIQNDCKWGEYKDYKDGWEVPYPFNLTEIDIDTFEACAPLNSDAAGSCFIIHKMHNDTLLFWVDDICLSGMAGNACDGETTYCRIGKFYLR